MRTIETKWFVYFAFVMPIIWVACDWLSRRDYTTTVQLTAINWITLGALYFVSDKPEPKND